MLPLVRPQRRSWRETGQKVTFLDEKYISCKIYPLLNVFVLFYKTESNLLCISEPLLSITWYPFTLTGLDFLCHTQFTVTVVLVTSVNFIWTASIKAGKCKTVLNC